MKKRLYIVCLIGLCVCSVNASVPELVEGPDSIFSIEHNATLFMSDTTFVLGAVDTTQVVADTTQFCCGLRSYPYII